MTYFFKLFVLFYSCSIFANGNSRLNLNTIDDSVKLSTPIKVYYGVFIKKMIPDFSTGKFYCEFYWWTRFNKPNADSELSVDDILNLEYVNGIGSDAGTIKSEIQEQREIKSSNEIQIYATGFHQGDFYFNANYSKYPFDHQTLSILIENSIITKDKLIFIADTVSYVASKQNRNYFGLSEDILKSKTSNYYIKDTRIYTASGIYNSDFGDPDFKTLGFSEYARIGTDINIKRSIIPFVSKLFIPLLIILLLVYFVFYLPAEKIDIAAGLTVTSLLSAIAFQLSVSGNLPDIGYIIYVDKVFYLCYFLIALAMGESIWTFYLDRSGIESNIKRAIRIDLWARFIFPILYFSGVILLAL